MIMLHHSSKTETRHTESWLILHVGVSVEEAVHVIRCEDAGLNEAQQREELLQVVLDGGSCQQDSEAN